MEPKDPIERWGKRNITGSNGMQRLYRYAARGIGKRRKAAGSEAERQGSRVIFHTCSVYAGLNPAARADWAADRQHAGMLVRIQQLERD